MKKKLLSWHIAGIIFVILFGSVWHFVYSLSGNNWLIALIAPVNESVWEHLKLAPIPLLLFSLLQYFYIGKVNKNFLTARAAALYLIPFLIVVLHYSYRTLLGHPVLGLDILIFGISVTIAELTSYSIMVKDSLPNRWRYFSLMAVLFLFIVFAFFTYNPLQWPVFLDSKTNKYGI